MRNSNVSSTSSFYQYIPMDFIIVFMWALASLIFFSSSFLSFTLNTGSFDGYGKKHLLFFLCLVFNGVSSFWSFNRIYICTACTDANFSRMTRQNILRKATLIASFPEFSALVWGSRKRNTLINVFTDINFLAELCLLYEEFMKKQKPEKLHFIDDTISTKSQQTSSPTQTASEMR